MRSVVLQVFLATLLPLVFWGTPAAAQRFGQWWWDATASATGRDYDNRLDGSRLSTFEQTDFELNLGLNGFIVHPAVARFRLGLDVLFSSVEGGRSLDTDRTGFLADVRLFPVGSHPIQLFLKRERYDYSKLTEEEPLTLLGVPDSTTTWGGRLRARRGALKGTLLGFEQTRLDFFLAGLAADVQQRAFFDWSAAGHKVNHHVRLERRFRDLGRVDLEFSDLTLNLDEHGDLLPSWRWDLSTVALRRTVRFERLIPTDVDSWRLRNQLTHTTRGGDAFNLAYSGGLSRATGGPTSQSHTLGGRYHWRRFKAWQITPFAEVAWQTSGDATLRAPQLGVSVNWSQTGRRFDVSLTGSASHRWLRRSGAVGDETQLGTSLLASVGHGTERRLRTELEASLAHNELRVAGETVSDLPDLGVTLGGLGTQDSRRARLTLRRRLAAALQAHAYSEWSQRESSDEEIAAAFDAETFTHSLQLSGSGFSFLANAGETRVGSARLADQRVRFTSVSISWRPVHFLSLRASYRDDQRQVVLGPDLDGDRAEAGLDFQLGALTLEARAFETHERLSGGTERTNRGLTWTVSRRLAGWLPIVTGRGRRGTIR